ncbi:hypothetical protein FACS1894166_07320 [Bacilli bacterium]|nr:hypothetical protein FACS1894166_07320 [Bacilli bacterium]
MCLDSTVSPFLTSYNVPIVASNNDFVTTSVDVQSIPEGYVLIDQNTIDVNSDYKVAAGNNVYYGTSYYKFGHDLLNLKKLSDDNDEISNFVINGSIDFGFLVDPNMDCYISGINEGSVTCDGKASNAVGVLVGKTTTFTDPYSKNLQIDSSITFTISSTGAANYSWSVLAPEILTNGDISINATFHASSDSYATSLLFKTRIVANKFTINGIFDISSTNASVMQLLYMAASPLIQ